MNVEPEIISHNRISLSRAKRRTENPTIPKPPEGSIENTTTLSSQTRELNPLTPTSESPIMIIEANKQQEPVVSPKLNKKIVSIKAKKITVSRTQPKSPVLEQEISIKSPEESPINFPRFDGLSSPSKSPTNFRYLDGDFLTEGDLLLSRNSSIPSPIGKNALSVNLAFDDPSLFKTISKTSNLYEGFNLDTPASQLGSITPHTISDAPMIEKYRVPHKKRDNILVLNEINSPPVSQKGGICIDSPVLSDEEAKESLSFDANRIKNERHKVSRNTPFNQGVTDQRVERDISSNNIRADTFDSPDQSHVNANQIANAADITSTAILINTNNTNSSINASNQQQQPAQTVVQADSATHNTTAYVMTDSDIKLYLRKNIMFFLACAAISLFYYFIISNKIPYHTIFITGYVYLASQIYENTRSARLRTDSDTWRKKEDILNTLDVLCLTIVLIIIHLKFENIFSISVFATIPVIIALITYSTKSSAPVKVRRPKLLTLVYLTIQIFLITLKFDQTMTADWQIVLLLTFAIIGAIAVFLIAYAFFTVFLFLALILRQYIDDRRSIIIQFIGLIWHVLYYGLTIGALFTAVGISQAYTTNGTYDTLNKGLIIACSTNGVLVIYTLIAWKPLAQFIKEYSMNSALEQEAVDVPKKSKIKFEVEKKPSYFVMLSSTYFLPLNHGLLAKNKKNLERVKKFMSMSKLANNSPKNSKKTQDDVTNSPISIQTLQEYKEKLDLTIERISSKINPFQIDETMKSPKHFRILSARFPDPPAMTNKESVLTDLKLGRSNSKLNLSADDMENLQRIDLSPQQEQPDGDENLCYLCYERVADAVLMNCGHGGICYECAIASNKVKNECVECRAPVVAIHKVDPHLKMVDVIKSLECSKIVVETES